MRVDGFTCLCNLSGKLMKGHKGPLQIYITPPINVFKILAVFSNDNESSNQENKILMNFSP